MLVWPYDRERVAEGERSERLFLFSFADVERVVAGTGLGHLGVKDTGQAKT